MFWGYNQVEPESERTVEYQNNYFVNCQVKTARVGRATERNVRSNRSTQQKLVLVIRIYAKCNTCKIKIRVKTSELVKKCKV